MYKPIRKADLVLGGTSIKQGEIFTLGFQLFDATGLVIVPTVGQTITVRVANKTGVVFETTAVVVGDHIEFTVAENIGAGKMRVELTVADGANVLQKYPANGYIELYITASLDDIGVGFIYTVTAAEMFTRIEGSEIASADAVQTAGEAVVIAGNAVVTADAVRADFDLVVAEAGSSNPEVVLARGGEADLSTRLNGVDSQLADTVEEVGVVKNKGELTTTFVNKTLLDATGSLKETATTITSDANHNAFPCIIRFNNLFHVYYRTGVEHATFDGVIKLKTSSDGVTWSAPTTVIQEVGYDYRDPSVIVFNGKMVMKAFYRIGTETKVCLFTSEDGIVFSLRIDLPTPTTANTASRGNMTVKDGALHMINYVNAGANYLYHIKTTDLVNFTIVNPLVHIEGNEASITWSGTKMICIYRQNKKDANNEDWDMGCGYVESLDNGVTWTNFKELPFGNHCPSIFKTVNGNNADTFLVVFRNTRYKNTENRTPISLVRLDKNGNLLSRDYVLYWAGGVWDVGYADVVEYNGSTHIVYYYWNGLGNIVVKKLDMYMVRDLSQYNKPVTIPDTLRVTHAGVLNDFKIVSGVINVTGDGTAKKQFTVNFTGVPYAFFYTPVNADGLYKAAHVSAVSGGATGVVTKDNGATFTAGLNVYYMIFVK